MKIENELDKWILAETYKMLAEVDKALETYELEPATKALTACMDSLTNRYLRRSRRRFWAEGMEQDKQAAYATLREVLTMYLQVAAPFTPFITESIWQEMQKFTEKDRDSIHVSYRPLGSDAYIDETLIDEITTVRKIIK